MAKKGNGETDGTDRQPARKTAKTDGTVLLKAPEGACSYSLEGEDPIEIPKDDRIIEVPYKHAENLIRHHGFTPAS